MFFWDTAQGLQGATIGLVIGAGLMPFVRNLTRGTTEISVPKPQPEPQLQVSPLALEAVELLSLTAKVWDHGYDWYQGDAIAIEPHRPYRPLGRCAIHGAFRIAIHVEENFKPKFCQAAKDLAWQTITQEVRRRGFNNLHAFETAQTTTLYSAREFLKGCQVHLLTSS